MAWPQGQARCADRASCLCGRVSQLNDEIAHIDLQRFGDLEHFDKVEPSFATFVLGDKRLWSPELLGELHLR
jgi:hypothetical protein